MRKLALIVVLTLMTLPAFAAHQTLSCSDCRDVAEHPMDFGNYAFNTLIEPLDDDFSMFTTYSTSAYVWNRNRQFALVMLDDVLEDTGVSVFLGGFTVPVMVSSEFVQITVQDQYGEVTTYQVIETSRPLVVGSGTTAPPVSSPDPVQEPTDDLSGANSSTGGIKGSGETSGSTLCCQSGAYYWYYDQSRFATRTLLE